MQNILKIEQTLKMVTCSCSTDIESSFDFYAEYEVDSIDHNQTVLV